MRKIIFSLLFLCTSLFAQQAPVAVGDGMFDVARYIELYNPNMTGEIHYTLDGSDPLPGSPVYMGPILRFVPTELKARVFTGDVGSAVTTVYVAPRQDYLAHFNCDRHLEPMVDSGQFRMQGILNNVGYTNGFLNSGIDFNGVGNVNLGVVNFTQTSASFATWVKFTSFNVPDGRLIDKSSGVAEQDHDFMVSTCPVGSSHRLRLRVRAGGTTSTLIATSGDLNLNQWYHVAAVYNGVDMMLFLNGEMVGSMGKTGTISSSNNLMFLGDNPAGNRCIDGVLDEIYLFDRSLTVTEIRSMATDRQRLGIEYVSDPTVGCTADLTTEVLSTFTSQNGLNVAGNQAQPNTVGWLMIDYEDPFIGLDIFPIGTDPLGQWVAMNIPVKDSDTYKIWTLWSKIGDCEAPANFIKSRTVRVSGIQQGDLFSVVEPTEPDPVDPVDPDPVDPVDPDPVTPPVAGDFDLYVSPSGNDANDGSLDSPWRTLAKAVSDAPNGATVGVMGGSYGRLTITAPRTGWVTLRAVEGTNPRIDGVGVGSSPLADVRVILDGFDIFSANYSPVLSIYNAKNFVARNCEIHANKWSVNKIGREGIDIFDSVSITIDKCYVHEVYRGVQIRNSDSTRIVRSLIRPKGSSGIQYLNGCTNTLIEQNNLWAETFTPYPQDPDAFPSPHQSAISIRSGSLTIRNNYIHGIGNSSGLMTYTPDAAGGLASYNDITIENNAIYDIINVYALRFYNLGRNVVVRNNLFHAGIRDTNTGAYYRHSAAIVHSTGPSYIEGGFTFSNNICIGAVYGIPSSAVFENNVMWSYNSNGWQRSFGTNYIVTSGSAIPPLFDNQTFFKNQINLNLIRTRGYVDWSLVDGELNIGPGGRNILLGDPALQPSDSLGTMDSDGYVLDDGKPRSSTAHDVGPLQR